MGKEEDKRERERERELKPGPERGGEHEKEQEWEFERLWSKKPFLGNRPCQSAFYEMLRCVERTSDTRQCRMETSKFLDCENYHFQKSIKTAVMLERERTRAREQQRRRQDEENEEGEVYTVEISIPTPVNPLKYYNGLWKDLYNAADPWRIYEMIGRIFGDLRVSGEATKNMIRRFFRNED